MVRYDRAPSEAFEELLRGPLEPLLRPLKVAGLALDLQLRENDTVQLYCGLTSLLVAKPVSGGFHVTAHDTYARQPCAEPLMRRWTLDEPGFGKTLADYLEGVKVGENHTRREGAVQAEWMAVQEPWIPVDREGVLGYANISERALALDCAPVQKAWDTARGLCEHENWATLKKLGDSNEVDQVAIGPEGELVLVELKHGAAADVYQAPVQALRYVWEWHAALETILPGLKNLVEARCRLGLAPTSTPDPGAKIRWALAVGREAPSVEVRRRLDVVRDLVNEHRPPEVPPLELWRLDDHGSPARL